MSGTVIAITDDPTALFWNPAGIINLDGEKIHFEGGHGNYFSLLQISHIATVIPLKGDNYIGVNYLHLYSDELPVTTEFQPFGTGQTYKTSDFAVGLSFAKVLTDNFSFGVNAKAVNEGWAGLKTFNVLADLGFQYQLDLRKIRFAVSLNNFGLSVVPKGELYNYTLNGIDTVNAFEELAAPAVFRLGAAMNIVESEDHVLTPSIQLNHPTDNNETFGIALQYVWNELLYARAGYLFGRDVSSLPSFGIGYKLKQRFFDLAIDYGYHHGELLGDMHRIGTTISFTPGAKKKVEDR